MSVQFTLIRFWFSFYPKLFSSIACCSLRLLLATLIYWLPTNDTFIVLITWPVPLQEGPTLLVPPICLLRDKRAVPVTASVASSDYRFVSFWLSEVRSFKDAVASSSRTLCSGVGRQSTGEQVFSNVSMETAFWEERLWPHH